MLKEQGQPYKGTNSIYLDEPTAKLARQVVEQTGKPFAAFIKQALDNFSHPMGGSLENAQIVYPPSDIDEHHLDEWIDVDSTERVFFMGTTMRRPIVDNSEFWQRFLENGKSLRVLLQGDLGTKEGGFVYTLLENEVEEVSRKRAETLETLKILSRTATKGSLAVREIKNSLISQSVIAVFGKKNSVGIQDVNIQIEPKLFLPEGYRMDDNSPRFLIRTRSNLSAFSFFFRPYSILWSSLASREKLLS
jgi:hypothetical protein